MTSQEQPKLFHYLALFAKSPSVGSSKTRLIPRLGPHGSALFALAALTDTLHLFSALPIHKTLFYTPSTARPALLSLLRSESLTSWEIQPQIHSPDLGSRLAAALEHSRTRTTFAGTVAFIAMDCFELTPSHIERSIAMASTGTPYMLPASDGGYVLLTLPPTCPPTVFDRISWSCDQTARLQIERLEEAGLGCTVGESLSDVDEPADLDQLWAGRTTKVLMYPRTVRYLEAVMTEESSTVGTI
ncbi:nucleotide-diphospho-sugar transferase [Cryomyces antarcticus]